MNRLLPNIPLVKPCHSASGFRSPADATYEPDRTMYLPPARMCILSPSMRPVSPKRHPSACAVNSFTRRVSLASTVLLSVRNSLHPRS